MPGGREMAANSGSAWRWKMKSSLGIVNESSCADAGFVEASFLFPADAAVSVGRCGNFVVEEIYCLGGFCDAGFLVEDWVSLGGKISIFRSVGKLLSGAVCIALFVLESRVLSRMKARYMKSPVSTISCRRCARVWL